MKQVKQVLLTNFDRHDLGEATFFLAMDFVRDRAARTKLTQKRLTAQLVDKYGLEDCRNKTLPLSTSLQLTKSDGELLDKETYAYTHITGSLLYVPVCTRPDIAQAVEALSKYMADPTVAH